MRVFSTRLLAVVVSTMLACGLQMNAASAQSETATGTWKLNVQKSKFNPGPAPQSQTITWEKVGDAMQRSDLGLAGMPFDMPGATNVLRTAAPIMVAPPAVVPVAAPARTFEKGAVIVNPHAGVDLAAWRTPAPCRLVAVRGYTSDGSALASIDASRNGAGRHLAEPLTLSRGHVWIDGGTVRDADYAAGDTLHLLVPAVRYPMSGGEVSIQCEFARP